MEKIKYDATKLIGSFKQRNPYYNEFSDEHVFNVMLNTDQNLRTQSYNGGVEFVNLPWEEDVKSNINEPIQHDSGDNGFLGKTFDKASETMNRFNTMVASAPGMLWETLLKPQNALSDATGWDWLKADSPIKADNSVSRYYQEQADDMAKNQSSYTNDIWDSLKKGNLGDAGAQMAVEGIGNIPMLLGLGVVGYTTGGIGLGAIGTNLTMIGTVGLGTAGARTTELRRGNETTREQITALGILSEPENFTEEEVIKAKEIFGEQPHTLPSVDDLKQKLVDEPSIFINSWQHGLNEGTFELLGSAGFGSYMGKLYSQSAKRMGKEQAFDLVQETLARMLKKIGIKYFPRVSFMEGAEEWSTEVANNISDIANGIQKGGYTYDNIFQGAANAYLIGMAAAGMTSQPIDTYSKYSQARAERKYKKAKERQNNEIYEFLDNLDEKDIDDGLGPTKTSDNVEDQPVDNESVSEEPVKTEEEPPEGQDEFDYVGTEPQPDQFSEEGQENITDDGFVSPQDEPIQTEETDTELPPEEQFDTEDNEVDESVTKNIKKVTDKAIELAQANNPAEAKDLHNILKKHKDESNLAKIFADAYRDELERLNPTTETTQVEEKTSKSESIAVPNAKDPKVIATRKKIQSIQKKIDKERDGFNSLKDNQEMVGALTDEEYKEAVKQHNEDLHKLFLEKNKLQVSIGEVAMGKVIEPMEENSKKYKDILESKDSSIEEKRDAYDKLNPNKDVANTIFVSENNSGMKLYTRKDKQGLYNERIIKLPSGVSLIEGIDSNGKTYVEVEGSPSQLKESGLDIESFKINPKKFTKFLNENFPKEIREAKKESTEQLPVDEEGASLTDPGEAFGDEAIADNQDKTAEPFEGKTAPKKAFVKMTKAELNKLLKSKDSMKILAAMERLSDTNQEDFLDQLMNHLSKIDNDLGGNEFSGNTSANKKFQITSRHKTDADTEIDNIAISFITALGLTVKQYDNIKAALGIDALGFTDLLTRLVGVATKRKIDTLPEEAAHLAMMLSGEKMRGDFNAARRVIVLSDAYRKVYEEYKTIYVDKDGQPDVNTIKQEAIAKVLAENIVHYIKTGKLTPSLRKLGDRHSSVIKKYFVKLMAFVRKNYTHFYFKALNKISSRYNGEAKAHLRKFNEDLDVEQMLSFFTKLTKDVAKNNFEKYLQETFIPKGFVKVDFDKAVNEDQVSLDVIRKMLRSGFTLTGSVVLAREGNIYRRPNEPMHDIDFVDPRAVLTNPVNAYTKRLSNIFGAKNVEYVRTFGIGKTRTHQFKINGKDIDIFSKRYDTSSKSPFNEVSAIFRAKLNFARSKDVRDALNFGSKEGRGLSGNVLYQRTGRGESISQNEAIAQTIVNRLKKQYPKISLKAVEKVFDKFGREVAGRAFQKVAEWSTTKGTLDTIPHEVFHVIFPSIKDHPIIKQALKKIGFKYIPNFLSGEFGTQHAIAFGYKNRGNKAVIQKLKDAYQKAKIEAIGDPIKVQLIALYREAYESAEGDIRPSDLFNDSVSNAEELINELGIEILTQQVGEYYAGRIKNKSLFNSIKVWIKQLALKLKSIFKNGALTEQELVDIIGEKFYSGQYAMNDNVAYQNKMQYQGSEHDSRGDNIDEESTAAETDYNFIVRAGRFFDNRLKIYLKPDQYAHISDLARKYSGSPDIQQDVNNFIKDLADYLKENGIELLRGKKNQMATRMKNEKGQMTTIRHNVTWKEFRMNQLKFMHSVFNAVSIYNDDTGVGDKVRLFMGIVGNDVDGYSMKTPMFQKTNDPLGYKVPAFERMSFMDFSNLAGKAKKFLYLSAKSIFQKVDITRFGAKSFIKKADPHNIVIGGNWLKQINNIYGRQYKEDGSENLVFFFAALDGDNSQLVFGITPDQYEKADAKAFENYFNDEKRNGRINNKHIKNYTEWARQEYKANKRIYGQIIGYHEMWKQTMGENYLGLTDSIGLAKTFKYLKLSFSGGTATPNRTSLMIFDPKEVVMTVHGKIINMFKDDGTYAFDGWQMVSPREMLKVTSSLGQQSPLFKSVVRDLSKNKNNKNMDFMAEKMMSMTAFEGTEIRKKTGNNRVEKVDFITPELLRENPDKIYLYGDNLIGKGKKGQSIVRDEPNAIGIPTKKLPSMERGSFMTDSELDKNIESIDRAFSSIPAGSTVVIPTNGIGTGLSKLEKFAPITFKYLQDKINNLEKTSGNELVARLEGEGKDAHWITGRKEKEWARTSDNGYEVSTKGHSKYSALIAKLSTGETIERAYQRLKGSGKGKPSINPAFDYWGTYLGLWKQWAKENPKLIDELEEDSKGKVLTDRFASTQNNQARALAQILTERSGKEVGHLVTRDEVKLSGGKYRNDYERYEISGEATRVLIHPGASKKNGAFPLLSPDLLVDNEFEKDSKVRKYLEEIKKHYRNTTNQYIRLLEDVWSSPENLKNFVLNDLQEGEIPSELHEAAEINPKLLLLPHFLRQLMPLITNKILSNGVLKNRAFNGKASKLFIKPKGPIEVKEGNIVIASDNKTVLKMVANAYIKDIGNRSWDKNKSLDDPGTIAILNKWLASNTFNLLVHRQPILTGTKVQVRRLQSLEEGWHGDTAFMTYNDVFRLHEADHDGDTVIIEKIPEDLEKAWVDMQKSLIFERRNRNVYSIFKTDVKGGSVSNYNDIRKFMTDNNKSRGSEGMVRNAGVILATLAYKNFSFKVGKKNIVSWKLGDKAILNYWELDPEELSKNNMRQTLRKQGDSIMVYLKEPVVVDGVKYAYLPEELANEKQLADNNGLFLQTTKEHEFSILLQMSVDDMKFRLLRTLGGDNLNTFLLSRMFKHENGAALKVDKNMAKDLRIIYKMFNYSSIFQGRDNIGQNTMDFHTLLNTVDSIKDRYKDLDGKDFSGEEVAEKIQRMIDNAYDYNNISEISLDNKLTPREELLSNLSIQTNDNEKILPPQDESDHKLTHGQVKDALRDKYEKDISLVGKNEKVRDKLEADAIKLSDEIDDVLEKGKKEREKTAHLEDREIASIPYDFDTEFGDILLKWVPYVKALTPIQHRYFNLYYMNNQKAGMYLMSTKLMNKDVMSDYADFYEKTIGNLANFDKNYLADRFKHSSRNMLTTEKTQSKENTENEETTETDCLF